MTKEEVGRVEHWLYSIPRTELALANLRRALDDLEQRMESPPTWMQAPSMAPIRGSQEAWLQFLDEYPARKSFLEYNIDRHNQKIKRLWEALDALKSEDSRAAEVIRKKYYDHVRPDRSIYTMFLFCGADLFYTALRFGISISMMSFLM